MSLPVPAAGSADGPAGLVFNNIRLGLNAKPPAACEPPLFGTITARAPDGALCLCRQGKTARQGFWEQVGTMMPCWPDAK
jgi:hypothetical protein